jgi:hypothetical protein
VTPDSLAAARFAYAPVVSHYTVYHVEPSAFLVDLIDSSNDARAFDYPAFASLVIQTLAYHYFGTAAVLDKAEVLVFWLCFWLSWKLLILDQNVAH